MTADIRTAAQREAERIHIAGITDDDYTVGREVAAFVNGARFGAKRVTPTHAQIRAAIKGRTPHSGATAVRAIMDELAEGES